MAFCHDNVPPKGPRPVIPGQIMPMMIEKPLRFPGKLRTLAGLAAVVCVASCGPATLPTGYDDPREAQNREIHDFNRSIDRALLRPASTGYDSVVPEPLKTGVSNVARNLDAPGDIVNGILQGRPADAGENTLRFAVNTVFGIGGLFDVSTALGMDGRSTDFGETLHVWGVGEGNYLEFPFLGPTTERDLIGTGVDIALNPMRYVLPNREGNAATGLKIASGLRDRARYSDTIDSVLYESADSYAQTRLLYLQSRRFELSNAEGEGGDDAFLDPYEDPYGE